MKTPWQRAVRECERWHQRVIMLNDEQYCEERNRTLKFHAPAHNAFIRNATKELVWFEGDMDREDAPSGLIHELCHVLVWIASGTPPDVVNEAEVMLAIEHEAHRRLRLPWSEWMCAYGAPNGEDWGRLSTKERGIYLALAYGNAEAYGLLKNDRPTYRLPIERP